LAQSALSVFRFSPYDIVRMVETWISLQLGFAPSISIPTSNRTDLGEQEYFREHLPFLEVRRVHFLRMTAAVEYLWAAARNARIIIQLAEGTKQSATPAVLETAERLQRNASLVCLHAFRVVPRLLLSALVPDVTRHAEFIAEDYSGVMREMSMLRMLLYSDRTRTGMVAGGYALPASL